MSINDVKGNVIALRSLIEQVAGAELRPKERETARAAAFAGLQLLEYLLVDLARIADATEVIAGELRKP